VHAAVFTDAPKCSQIDCMLVFSQADFIGPASTAQIPT